MSPRRDAYSPVSPEAQIVCAMQSEMARWGLGGRAGFVAKIRWLSGRRLPLSKSEQEVAGL